MVDAVTTQVYDGDHNYVITVEDISDGTGLTALKIVDVTTMHPNPGTHLVLWKVDYDIGTLGGVTLYWEGTPNKVLLALEPAGMDRDISRFGGLRCDASAATGNVLVSTHGFTNQSTFSITLEFKKGGLTGFTGGGGANVFITTSSGSFVFTSSSSQVIAG